MDRARATTALRDADNNPLLLYSGQRTTDSLEVGKGNSNDYGRVIYATTSPARGEAYASSGARTGVPHVREGYAAVQRPFDVQQNLAAESRQRLLAALPDEAKLVRARLKSGKPYSGAEFYYDMRAHYTPKVSLSGPNAKELTNGLLLKSGFDAIKYTEKGPTGHGADVPAYAILRTEDWVEVARTPVGQVRTSASQVRPPTTSELGAIAHAIDTSARGGDAVGLVNAAMKHPDVAARFSASNGKEQRTLGKHTEDVITSYDRLFGAGNTGPADVAMRKALLLHDIGKNSADGRGQHVSTSKWIEENAAAIGYTRDETRMARALVKHDPIGGVLAGDSRYSVASAATDIREMAQTANMKPLEFFNALTRYYQADVASYPALRNVFAGDGQAFVRTADGRLQFSPVRETRYSELRQALESPSR